MTAHSDGAYGDVMGHTESMRAPTQIDVAVCSRCRRELRAGYPRRIVGRLFVCADCVYREERRSTD